MLDFSHAVEQLRKATVPSSETLVLISQKHWEQNCVPTLCRQIHQPASCNYVQTLRLNLTHEIVRYTIQGSPKSKPLPNYQK